MGQVPAPVKRRVLARDGGCVGRGILPGLCRGPLDAGHLVGRGSGGTQPGDRYDGIDWIVTHCRAHNGAIEDDPATRRAARAAGQRYSRTTPALIPERALVLYPDGHHYHLTTDGTKERADDPWIASST